MAWADPGILNIGDTGKNPYACPTRQDMVAATAMHALILVMAITYLDGLDPAHFLGHFETLYFGAL
jgi:hypothetical protein